MLTSIKGCPSDRWDVLCWIVVHTNPYMIVRNKCRMGSSFITLGIKTCKRFAFKLNLSTGNRLRRIVTMRTRENWLAIFGPFDFLNAGNTVSVDVSCIYTTMVSHPSFSSIYKSIVLVTLF